MQIISVAFHQWSQHLTISHSHLFCLNISSSRTSSINKSMQYEVRNKRKKYWKKKHNLFRQNLKALRSFFNNGLQFRTLRRFLVRYHKRWCNLAIAQFLCRHHIEDQSYQIFSKKAERAKKIVFLLQNMINEANSSSNCYIEMGSERRLGEPSYIYMN